MKQASGIFRVGASDFEFCCPWVVFWWCSRRGKAPSADFTREMVLLSKLLKHLRTFCEALVGAQNKSL